MAYVEIEKVLETARDGHHSDFGRSMADLTSLREVLEDTPTADVAEVRHGRDVGDMNDRDDWYEPVHICSICDCGFMMDFDEEAHYCPNCGAKMDGGKAE